MVIKGAGMAPFFNPELNRITMPKRALAERFNYNSKITFMETNERMTAEVVDVQEFCNLLISNGYLLVKVPEEMDADSVRKLLDEDKRRTEQAQLWREAERKSPRILAAIKQWRQERAVSDDVPQYMVLTNKAMLQIAIQRPGTIDELLAIQGFGPMKAKKYGQEILQIITKESDVPPRADNVQFHPDPWALSQNEW